MNLCIYKMRHVADSEIYLEQHRIKQYPQNSHHLEHTDPDVLKLQSYTPAS